MISGSTVRAYIALNKAEKQRLEDRAYPAQGNSEESAPQSIENMSDQERIWLRPKGRFKWWNRPLTQRGLSPGAGRA